MSLVKLDTGFNIEIEFPITPFHKRLFAWVIDLIVQIAYLWIVEKIIAGMAGAGWESAYPWLAVIYFMPVLLYHFVCELILNGQSPGKKAAGIKVITEEGGQPSVSQYLLRWAFKPIDLPFWLLFGIIQGGWPGWMFIFVFSGLACLIMTKRSQRIGDLIAGTVLIDTQNKTSWQDTVFMDVEENYQAAFPEVMRLSDRDINSIKQVLGMVQTRFDNREYADRVARKIKTALNINTDMDCVDFLEKLIKDYNHLSSQ